MMGRGREGKGGSLVSSLTPSHRPPRPSFFPSSQSPYDTKRPQCGGEMHDWKNAITFANLFLGKTQYYLFNQKMIS